jgi:amidase
LATGSFANYLLQSWCRRTSRTDGIDFALNPVIPGGRTVHLDALLTPSDDNGAGTNIPAQAGYPIITIVGPTLFPLCIS